jgi:hypothetical protein
MPIYYRKREIKPSLEFGEIDKVVLREVFPNLNWMPYGRNGKMIRILPNFKQSLIRIDGGASLMHNPGDYFVLMCLEKMLGIGDSGFWIDESIKMSEREVFGRQIRIKADTTTLLRFDGRKPIYYASGVSAYFLMVFS